MLTLLSSILIDVDWKESFAALDCYTLCGLLKNQVLDEDDHDGTVSILLNLRMLIREILQIVYHEFTLPAG